MSEYFIFANSFAAPFCSDTSTHFQEAPDPKSALQLFHKKYDHPCGLYSAACYERAESYHKGGEILARWLSRHAQMIERRNAGTIQSEGPGLLILDGKPVKVENPKHGKVVP